MFSGFDIVGFELGVRRIWWDADDAVPWMSVPSSDGGEISQRVANPAFAVTPGAITARRPAMKRAALAFFAPLLCEEGAS